MRADPDGSGPPDAESEDTMETKDRILATIEQVAPLSRARFEVTEDSIHVQARGWIKRHEFSMPLGSLDVHTARVRDVDKNSMGTAAFCTFAALAMTAAFLGSVPSPLRTFWGILLLACSVAAAGTWTWFFFRLRSSIVIYNRFNGYPVLFLDQNRPSEEEVTRFLEALKSAIGTAPDEAAEGQASMAEEIRKLARLKEDGSLTEDEFDLAKAQILGRERSKFGF